MCFDKGVCQPTRRLRQSESFSSADASVVTRMPPAKRKYDTDSSEDYVYDLRPRNQRDDRVYPSEYTWFNFPEGNTYPLYKQPEVRVLCSQDFVFFAPQEAFFVRHFDPIQQATLWIQVIPPAWTLGRKVQKEIIAFYNKWFDNTVSVSESLASFMDNLYREKKQV